MISIWLPLLSTTDEVNTGGEIYPGFAVIFLEIAKYNFFA